MAWMDEAIALLVVWLGFMFVVGVYVVRIGLLVREQRLLERDYRLRLATRRGRTVGEMSAAGESSPRRGRG